MSSASRFLRFGLSLFLRIVSNIRSHKTLSPILYLKSVTSLQFHLDRSSSTAATKDGDGIAETSNSLQKQQNHPWPQLVNFVGKLKTRGCFVEIPTNSTSDDNVSTVSSFRVMDQLQRGCVSFARYRYDVFKSLTISDVKTVVESGCPTLLRKAVDSSKRLRAYVQVDEGDACSSFNLRSSRDRAHVILKGKEAEGCTVDIVWILMSYALDPLVISEGEKSPGRELIEASARKLLSELIELSETPLDPTVSKHIPKVAHKERDVDFMGGILCEHVEMKKGDWICPKNINCFKCKAAGPMMVDADDVELKKGDWNCTKCGFMNFACNKLCLRCHNLRRERKPGEWDCPSCDFLNYSKNEACLRCKCERPTRLTGAWHCPSCNFFNFDRNGVCLNCKFERPKRMTREWHCPLCDYFNFSRNEVCLDCKRPEKETTENEQQTGERPHKLLVE